MNKQVASTDGTNKSVDYGRRWYFYWLEMYGDAEGQAAQTAFDDIVVKYFPAGKPL